MIRSDALIWEKFRQGDKAAFSHIYHQHVNDLYNFGMKYSNNHELVKDNIQELFLDLIRTKESLGKVQHIRHYLMVSLKRRIIKELVKQKKMTDFDPEDNRLPFDIEYSLEESLLNNELADERSRELVNALKKLSPRQKEIIYLRINCEMDYPQIGEIMNLTYDAARKLMYRAIKALKKAVQVGVKY